MVLAAYTSRLPRTIVAARRLLWKRRHDPSTVAGAKHRRPAPSPDPSPRCPCAPKGCPSLRPARDAAPDTGPPSGRARSTPCPTSPRCSSTVRSPWRRWTRSASRSCPSCAGPSPSLLALGRPRVERGERDVGRRLVHEHQPPRVDVLQALLYKHFALSGTPVQALRASSSSCLEAASTFFGRYNRAFALPGS